MTSEQEVCAGYPRKPHSAPIALAFQHPDGHTTGLCRICANRWLLSDEEFPPGKFGDKTSIRTNLKVAE